MSSPEDEKRKNRFGWVKRLMQGQQRTPHGVSHQRGVTGQSSQLRFAETPDEHEYDDADENGSVNSDTVSGSYADNASTAPLKSLGSNLSTVSPSVISDQHQDGNSIVASTAETSITPSNYQAMSQISNTSTANAVTAPTIPDRDSESIVTLASSSRQLRRRSLDTNCSTAGIPPASILERLSVNPTAGNSSYAMSVDRASFYKDETSILSDEQFDKQNDIRSQKS